MPINEASPTAVNDTLNESKTILNISRSKEKIN
jgi:hypothetical protein